MCKSIELWLYKVFYSACPWLYGDLTETDQFWNIPKIIMVILIYISYYIWFYVACQTKLTVNRSLKCLVLCLVFLIAPVYLVYFVSLNMYAYVENSEALEFICKVLATVYFVLGVVNLKNHMAKIKGDLDMLQGGGDDAIP